MIFISTQHAPANSQIIYLDLWDKLAIVAAAGLFLALVVICMMCVLSPACWLYKYCPFQHDALPQIKTIPPPEIGYGATDTLLYKNKKPQDLTEKIRLGTLREHDSSDWSDSSGTIELRRTSRRSPSLLSGILQMPEERPTALASGKLEFTIKYDKLEGKLILTVKEILSLNMEEVTDIISPYIRVRLYRAPRHIFSFGKESVINNLDLEFQTKLQKASDNPVFNETFVVSIDPKDIKLYTIKLQLCDLDRLSRHVVLGETTLVMKKTELPDFEEVHFSQAFEPPVEEDIGEIFIGLNYLPTAEKLYTTISKVRGLKPMSKERNTTDAYVKTVLMHEGRQLKKAKTVIKRSDLNPEYDETVAFDVPKHHLNNVYFCVAVIHANKEQKEHKLIGRMYLGPSFSADAHAHWIEMTQNPRKQVTCWHKLYV